MLKHADASRASQSSPPSRDDTSYLHQSTFDPLQDAPLLTLHSFPGTDDGTFLGSGDRLWDFSGFLLALFRVWTSIATA